MFELMVAAKLLLTAPHSAVGFDRAKIEARFGRPNGVGTDFRQSPAGNTAGRIVTLEWPDLRIRLYASSVEGTAASLLGVTTTSDAWMPKSPVRIGTDRGIILRELGGPFYEDEDQIVYALIQDDPNAPNDTVRIVLRDDRVVGFDWTFPIAE